MSTVVVIPGGFHPFHAGHKALYDSAVKAFPGASIYLAASNDTKTRPFPFSVKEKLAKLSGIPSGQLVQVKSPFQPREITSQFDPASDVLIFVRSEKDKNESPTLGGTKKDGSASYLQPYTKGQLQPFGKQAYMAYLPTVDFGPGLTSATEIRDVWPTLNDKRKSAMVMSLYPATQQNKRLVNVVVRLLDSSLSEAKPLVVKESNDISIDWGDYKFISNMDTRLSVFAEALRSQNNVLHESNEKKSNDYFLSLNDMADAPKINKKYLLVCLAMVNNKVIQIIQPTVGKLLSFNSGRYTMELDNGIIDEYPTSKMINHLSTLSCIFNNENSYNKFRTVMSLRFDFSLNDWEQMTGSSTDGAESMNENQNLLQVPNNIANTVAELLNHKKPELFTRYGPEYVMNIIQDVCTETPNKSITELAIETIHQLKKQINESNSMSDTNTDHNLSVEQLAQISDKALDDAYHYGRSTPGANFGWMANLQSAKAAKRLIDSGETDIEKISDAIHKGWNVTAAADYKGQLQLDTPTPEDKKLKRAKLAMQSYAQLPEEEKEKDRVVARALLSAIKGGELDENLGLPQPGTYEQEYNMYKTPGRQRRTTELTTEEADHVEKQVNVTESADYLEEK
jgi:hypothetical protein